MRRFLDTNVITYMLKQQHSVVATIRQMIANGDDLYVPSIAYYETQRWLFINQSGHKLTMFNSMLNIFPVMQMTTETYDIAAHIYADLSTRGNIIEDTDILIAASTIEHGAVLLTNNTAHFKRIDGLAFEQMS